MCRVGFDPELLLLHDFQVFVDVESVQFGLFQLNSFLLGDTFERLGGRVC